MKENHRSKNIKRIRGIARFLSIVIFILTITLLVSSALAAPGENLSLVYWLLLGLWCLSALCLVAAWRWELVGSILAVTALVSREMVYMSLSGKILVDFWQVWLPILFPAALFILARTSGKKIDQRSEFPKHLERYTDT